MTRDDIIRLSREAGFADGVPEIVGLEGFARFAALVAEQEREEMGREFLDFYRDMINIGDKDTAFSMEYCMTLIRMRSKRNPT
jgi:hypothetical protein